MADSAPSITKGARENARLFRFASWGIAPHIGKTRHISGGILISPA